MPDSLLTAIIKIDVQFEILHGQTGSCRRLENFKKNQEVVRSSCYSHILYHLLSNIHRRDGRFLLRFLFINVYVSYFLVIEMDFHNQLSAKYTNNVEKCKQTQPIFVVSCAISSHLLYLFYFYFLRSCDLHPCLIGSSSHHCF